MKYGLGITTHREGDKRTPEEIKKIVIEEIFNKSVNLSLTEINLSYGVYKGVLEPSVSPIFTGQILPYDFMLIKQFKKKYNQESILLFKYGKGTSAVEFSNIEDIKLFQEELLKFTKNKMGEYLTYIPEKKKAFILCVKDFGMDCEEFTKIALLSSKKFKLKIFKTENKIL